MIAGLIPPTSVTATASSGTVTLGWSAVSGATGYSIFRGPRANLLEDVGAVGVTNIYIDTGVTNGSTYYYSLKTKMSENYSEFSEVKMATPLAKPAVSASQVASSNAVKLSWAGVTGASNYEIYQGREYKGQTASTTYTLSGLNWGDSYSYQVAASNNQNNGYSGKSDPVSVTINLQKPVITNIQRAGSSITVRWDAVSGAATYEIQRKDGQEWSTPEGGILAASEFSESEGIQGSSPYSYQSKQ